MKRYLVLAALCSACVAGPEVLRDDVDQLEAVARATQARHSRYCSPPPATLSDPGAPLTLQPPPVATVGAKAVCGALQQCARRVKDAAHACQAGVDLAAQAAPEEDYRDGVRACQRQHEEALRRCRLAGVDTAQVLAAARQGGR